LSTCTDLSWDIHPKGDYYICGGTPSCSGVSTQSEAHTTCKTEGARLCTAQEILDDEPTGTGCDYDSDLVWTQSSCACDRDCLNTEFRTDGSGRPTGSEPNCCNDDAAASDRFYVM
jgi:hypothetical protein